MASHVKSYETSQNLVKEPFCTLFIYFFIVLLSLPFKNVQLKFQEVYTHLSDSRGAQKALNNIVVSDGMLGKLKKRQHRSFVLDICT